MFKKKKEKEKEKKRFELYLHFNKEDKNLEKLNWENPLFFPYSIEKKKKRTLNQIQKKKKKMN